MGRQRNGVRLQHLQPESSLGGGRLVEFRDRGEFLEHIQRRAMELRVRQLGAGQKHQTVDHVRQAHALFERGFDRRLVVGRRARPSQRDFQLPAQVVDRRAQLVRQVGGQAGEPLEGILDVREHPVERFRENGELGRQTATLDSLVQIARSDAAGRRRDGVNGAHAMSRNAVSHDSGGQKRNAEDHPETSSIVHEQILLGGSIDRFLDQILFVASGADVRPRRQHPAGTGSTLGVGGQPRHDVGRKRRRRPCVDQLVRAGRFHNHGALLVDNPHEQAPVLAGGAFLLDFLAERHDVVWTIAQDFPHDLDGVHQELVFLAIDVADQHPVEQARGDGNQREGGRGVPERQPGCQRPGSAEPPPGAGT